MRLTTTLALAGMCLFGLRVAHAGELPAAYQLKLGMSFENFDATFQDKKCTSIETSKAQNCFTHAQFSAPLYASVQPAFVNATFKNGHLTYYKIILEGASDKPADVFQFLIEQNSLKFGAVPTAPIALADASGITHTMFWSTPSANIILEGKWNIPLSGTSTFRMTVTQYVPAAQSNS